MMHNWFECKIRYEKVAENGTAIMDVYPYEADPDVKPEFKDAEVR